MKGDGLITYELRARHFDDSVDIEQQDFEEADAEFIYGAVMLIICISSNNFEATYTRHIIIENAKC